MLAPEVTTARRCTDCKLRKKKLRLKCDGSLPYCVRCVKSGRNCSGYEVKMKIRDMTRIAEYKVQSRTAIRDSDRGGSHTGEVIHDGHLVTLDAALKSPLDALRAHIGSHNAVPRSIPTDWHQIAIPRFFVDFGAHSDLFPNGDFRFLTQIDNQQKSNPHFSEALRAVSYMSLANQLGKKDLSIEARKLYGSAIIKVAAKLKNVQEATDDTVVASSFLFSLFEIISVKEVRKGFWNNAHDFGRISLLRARESQELQGSLGVNLFSIIIVHNLLKCISSHLNPPDELLNWLSYTNVKQVPAGGPCGRFLRCAWAIAKFCAAAQVLFDSTEQDDKWVLDLLQLVKVAIALENRCEEWDDGTFKESDIWIYRTCHPRSSQIKISPKYPPHFYHDTFVSWTWNFYRACRIRLHEVLLHCLTCIQSHPCVQIQSLDPETIGNESRAVIADMIFDICCSTYFCMGQINSKGEPSAQRPIPHWGYQAFWPYYVGMVSAKKGSESRAWLRENLEYITSSTGVELGVMLARRPDVDPWDIR